MIIKARIPTHGAHFLRASITFNFFAPHLNVFESAANLLDTRDRSKGMVGRRAPCACACE